MNAAAHITAWAGDRMVSWELAEEAPVALFTNGCPRGVMLATPADLEDFATGFLLAERVVPAADAIRAVKVAQDQRGAVLDIQCDPDRLAPSDWRSRRMAGLTGCGLCGVEDLAEALPDLPRLPDAPPPAPEAVLRAFRALDAHQPLNQRNHSTHAAALCDRTGAIVLVREDVGRHNALDKLVGAMARARLAPGDGFLLMSSRCSSELVQKAAFAGFTCLASVSAPTALAVDLARGAGLHLAALAGPEAVLFLA